MAFLEIDGLTKAFGAVPILDGVSLAIARGETLALLGPSGSGKTTLLRVVAGFENADAGRLTVAGEDLAGAPPARRGFGMVFQHYALFPHLSVAENVAFGLESRGWGKERVAARVEEMLALVHLEGFGGRRVDRISGGQQQRVALARALAPEPRVLLLDEPLSNLDPALRERTRRELVEVIARVGITALWVTHEQEEAFDVGNRVAVLNEGALEQVGPPEELYREPASRFVAFFVGRASALAGRWSGGAVRVERPGAVVDWAGVSRRPLPQGAAVLIVFRPEELELAPPGAAGALAGEIAERRYRGAVSLYAVRLAGGGELEVEGGAAAARPGEPVAVRPRPGAAGRAFAAPGAG